MTILAIISTTIAIVTLIYNFFNSLWLLKLKFKRCITKIYRSIENKIKEKEKETKRKNEFREIITFKYFNEKYRLNFHPTLKKSSQPSYKKFYFFKYGKKWITFSITKHNENVNIAEHKKSVNGGELKWDIISKKTY